jgi:hypothetical protein
VVHEDGDNSIAAATRDQAGAGWMPLGIGAPRRGLMGVTGLSGLTGRRPEVRRRRACDDDNCRHSAGDPDPVAVTAARHVARLELIEVEHGLST